MQNFWRTIGFMLALIALYLVVVNSGGSAAVLKALTDTTVGETKALQGR